MSAASSDGDRYLVAAFLQACQVMDAFHKPNEILRLKDVVARTGLPKGTAFRLLYTLDKAGFVEKTGENQYRLRITMPKRSRHRIGYDMNSRDTGFTGVVSESLVQAAADDSMELITLDNQDGAASLRNADVFIRERVDLVVEFQGDESIAEALAAKFAESKIPVIAIDVPHPGAFYFGANNYRAGVLAGHAMGRWAKLHWQHAALDVVLIEYARAGSIPQSRVKGMLAGFRHIWRSDECRLFHLDSIGDFQSSYDSVRNHISRVAPRKTVVAAVNDPAALAAIRAFEEAGLSEFCAVMSQDAEPNARAEMRRPDTRMIGSVAYFPEMYGPRIIALARKILAGPPPPRAVFTKHVLVTPENVDRIYPNDALFDTPVTAANAPALS
jgi:ribose transport system substrate-binding protein